MNDGHDHQWTVREGFRDYEIRVDLNPRNGKAVIRLDGRIVASPIESDHDDRELDVGTSRYRVVRMGRERFELEIVPLSQRPVAGKSVARKPSATATAKWPGHLLKLGVTAVLLIFVLSAWEMGAAYFTPWPRFDAPDGAYSVKLPAEPKLYESSGMDVAEVRADDCFYLIGSKRLDRENYKYDDHRMLDEMIRGWKRSGAEIVSTEVLDNRNMVAGRTVVMNYKGKVDGKQVDSSMKILACSTHDWVLIAVAEYPREGKAPRMKIDRFFRSISPGF